MRGTVLEFVYGEVVINCVSICVRIFLGLFIDHGKFMAEWGGEIDLESCEKLCERVRKRFLLRSCVRSMLGSGVCHDLYGL